MKTTNLRIPDGLHKALKKSAEINHRSLNGEILHALEFYLMTGSKIPVQEAKDAISQSGKKPKGG